MRAFLAHNTHEQERAGSLSEDEQRLLIALLEKMTIRSVRFGARHRA
jgi:hypothetical protein